MQWWCSLSIWHKRGRGRVPGQPELHNVTMIQDKKKKKTKVKEAAMLYKFYKNKIIVCKGSGHTSEPLSYVQARNKLFQSKPFTSNGI